MSGGAGGDALHATSCPPQTLPAEHVRVHGHDAEHVGHDAELAVNPLRQMTVATLSRS